MSDKIAREDFANEFEVTFARQMRWPHGPKCENVKVGDKATVTGMDAARLEATRAAYRDPKEAKARAAHLASTRANREHQGAEQPAKA